MQAVPRCSIQCIGTRSLSMSCCHICCGSQQQYIVVCLRRQPFYAMAVSNKQETRLQSGSWSYIQWKIQMFGLVWEDPPKIWPLFSLFSTQMTTNGLKKYICKTTLHQLRDAWKTSLSLVVRVLPHSRLKLEPMPHSRLNLHWLIKAGRISFECNGVKYLYASVSSPRWSRL